MAPIWSGGRHDENFVVITSKGYWYLPIRTEEISGKAVATMISKYFKTYKNVNKFNGTKPLE